MFLLNSSLSYVFWITHGWLRWHLAHLCTQPPLFWYLSVFRLMPSSEVLRWRDPCCCCVWGCPVLPAQRGVGGHLQKGQWLPGRRAECELCSGLEVAQYFLARPFISQDRGFLICETEMMVLTWPVDEVVILKGNKDSFAAWSAFSDPKGEFADPANEDTSQDRNQRTSPHTSTCFLYTCAVALKLTGSCTPGGQEALSLDSADVSSVILTFWGSQIPL